MNAIAAQVVGHLIVILQVEDERVCRFVSDHRAPRLLLPVMDAALERQIPV